MDKIKTVIMGAAGRDFHNFLTYFKENETFEVVAFTATQIPGIEERLFPASMSGPLYPEGIPIRPEETLPQLIKEHDVKLVVFAYSDVSNEYVMNKGAWVNSLGADYMLMGGENTMIKSKKPVIAVCAVRTGCGKSQTTRRVIEILKANGKKVVAIRHPMPYDPNLASQEVQRFEKIEDLEKYNCTIEEMEEYEPHIRKGVVVFAGVDYGKILKEAEKEADVILWDGGNNDLSFYKPDLLITLVDPHRPGHELLYYPGQANFRMADIVLINKVGSADQEGISQAKKNITEYNPNAIVIEGESPVSVENPEAVKGKRVLIVEDGPTLTHGGMTFGAGELAAQKYDAGERVDPRPNAVGSIKETYEKYTHIGKILPAMGYGKKQVKELEETINATDCDVVIAGTPIDLGRIVNVNKPIVNVTYVLKERGLELEEVLGRF